MVFRKRIFYTVCFIKNSKRYWLICLSLSFTLSSICIAIVYYFMEVVKIRKTKLQLICEIMNAHATYLSSQTSSWNFYICVFLTLRPIWLCCSFYITCNNIMCFIILRTNCGLAPYFFLHIKVCANELNKSRYYYSIAGKLLLLYAQNVIQMAQNAFFSSPKLLFRIREWWWRLSLRWWNDMNWFVIFNRYVLS